MVNTIWEDVKRQYYSGSTITRLLLVNIGIFLFFRFLWLGMYLVGAGGGDRIYNILDWFSISSSGFEIITRPWTIITNMFLHFKIGHIFWNMLFLYWFGRILQDLIGSRKILAIYVLSGLAGALAYVISANINPSIGGYAMGASGAIMGIILTAATLAPHFQIHLLFVGGVKLMYVALVVVVLDLIALPSDINTGGHFAHLGGAAMGFFLAKQMQNGNDWTVRFNNIFDKIIGWFQNTFTRRPKPKVIYKNPNIKSTKRKKGNRTSDSSMSKEERQAKIDAILDKIKREGGYNNLSDEEKEFLFKAGKNN